MGSDDQKHGDSDTSSDQETSRMVSPNGSKDGLGRSYECTFCKRGFTNAQALGGHMNIHRKDKAKAKQHTTASSKPNNKDHRLIVSSKSFNQVLNKEYDQYHGSSYSFQTSDDHGYQFIPSNPNFQFSFAASQFDINPVLHEEHLRMNLNLEIGTSELENGNIEMSRKVVNEDWFENGVDLELRLGHYP